MALKGAVLLRGRSGLNNPLQCAFADKVKYHNVISGLYYKPMMIVNDNARVVNKLEASLTDNARVVIYDRHMFIVQAAAHIRYQSRKTIVLSCHRCLIDTGVEKMNYL